jgi:radical SAM protein with 4Fe4S-binding SPASM domain
MGLIEDQQSTGACGAHSTAGIAFKNVGWSVGNYCNANCGHCYSREVRGAIGESLTEAEVIRIVEQLVRLGVRSVNLGGNEPIFTHGSDARRSILPFVIRSLTDAGIAVGLTTNGVTFRILADHHPDIVQLLNDVDFSLDSPVSEQHDQNRGCSLFALVTEGIERAHALGIATSIIVCAVRESFNQPTLEAFLELTRRLGSEIRINTLKPVDPRLIASVPSIDQFYEGFSFLMKNTDCITLGESCLTAFTKQGSRGCPCGTASFRINSKDSGGRISLNPCVYLHDFAVGDLLTDDIFDVLQSPQFEAFAERRRLAPTPCRESGCEYLELCRGGCAARTYLSSGTIDAADPYCPHEYVQLHGREPDVPKIGAIGCADGIRVHADYLCTWIGVINDRSADISSPAIGRRSVIHEMSAEP